MRILVADDDAFARKALEGVLRHMGHEVAAVEGGRQALDASRQEHYPLLIADWEMGEVDGLALCRALRARLHEPYTYVIVLTVHEGKSAFLDAMEAGADDFVSKPFDPDELAARVRVAERILDVRSRLRDLESLLSMCAYCKRLREDDGSWVPTDAFLARRDHSVSHGICPGCWVTHVQPDLDALMG